MLEEFEGVFQQNRPIADIIKRGLPPILQFFAIAVAVFDAFWKSKSPHTDIDYVDDLTPL